ncbi:MAG: endonuclease/exonuclease/phosphatase family protein, partial [Planctomycetota bacterium]|nr:endonuclease/exonuclease/phosphatase family protein [Planctomycetota bacterium]
MRTSILALTSAAFLGCAGPASTVRVATYNVALNRNAQGALVAELEAGSSAATAIAAVVRAVDADVILLQEVDRDPDGRAPELLRDRYLEPSPGRAPYAFLFAGASNTGEPSGQDLDGN